jgi:hypothetical protein
MVILQARMTASASTQLQAARHLLAQWAWRRSLAEAALACLFALPPLWMLMAGLTPLQDMQAALTAGALSLAVGGIYFARNRQSALQVALLLNRQHPSLQESAHLILLEEHPTLPAAIQADYAARALLGAEGGSASWGHPLRPYLKLFGVAGAWCVLAAAIAWLLLAAGGVQVKGNGLGKVSLQATEVAGGGIAALRITVTPPAYTRLGAKQFSELNIGAAEGSVVEWRVATKGAVQNVRLVFADTVIGLQPTANEWRGNTRAMRTRVYTLAYEDAAGRHDSEPTALTVTPDQAPVLALQQPESVTEIRYGSAMQLNIAAQLRDDYGLAAAELVLTLARGKGEGVRFEEKTLTLQGPWQTQPQLARVTQSLSLRELRLAPGDELYGYLRVADNRQPTAQVSRSETFFVQLEDTAAPASDLAMSMGVNRMPQYFRSQRQIIIDTEKLIAAKSGLDKKEFVLRSNDIGIDQKVLRLRYGQFLGEEFESGMTQLDAGHEANNEGESEEAHDHDHEAGDGHAHEAPGDALRHNHAQENAAGTNPGASVMAQFGHVHDVEEQATFLPEAVKATLKASLAQMWEAELRLRTGQPEAALPYEERALKLLKEVQQKSRMYVRKVGFEAPPLKPDEKRLTGELDAVKPGTIARNTTAAAQGEAVRIAYGVLARSNDRLAAGQAVWLQAAGNELAQAAAEHPAQYLAALGDLRKLIRTAEQQTPLCNDCKLRVMGALFGLLQAAPATPQPAAADNRLAKLYHQQLRQQR